MEDLSVTPSCSCVVHLVMSHLFADLTLPPLEQIQHLANDPFGPCLNTLCSDASALVRKTRSNLGTCLESLATGGGFTNSFLVSPKRV